MVHVKVRGELGEIILFYHMGLRDQTRVFRFGSEHLYPLSHLPSLSLVSQVTEALKTGPAGGFRESMCLLQA
jgi:hypothetical protein